MKNRLKYSLMGAAALVGGSLIVAQAQHHRGGPQHGEMLEQIDTDGDGNITRAEADAAHAARHAEADANGDGGISIEEFAAAREARREERRQRRQQAFFDRADANGDGVISLDESDNGLDRLFAHADDDGDGVITAAEREAAAENRRGQRRDRDRPHHERPD